MLLTVISQLSKSGEITTPSMRFMICRFQNTLICTLTFQVRISTHFKAKETQRRKKRGLPNMGTKIRSPMFWLGQGSLLTHLGCPVHLPLRSCHYVLAGAPCCPPWALHPGTKPSPTAKGILIYQVKDITNS